MSDIDSKKWYLDKLCMAKGVVDFIVAKEAPDCKIQKKGANTVQLQKTVTPEAIIRNQNTKRPGPH